VYNLLNVHDLVEVYQFARGKGVGYLTARLGLGKARRTAQAWNTKKKGRGIPEYLYQRTTRKVTKGAAVDVVEHFARGHLGRYAPDGGAVGISFGCGSGEKEIRWGSTGYFSRLEGVDLAPRRIETGMASVREAGLEQVVRLQCGNMLEMPLQDGAYDVVMFQHSLHHMAPVEGVLSVASRILKPDGLLYLDEFVGPTRFQWTDDQLRLSNAILRLIPERYRRDENGFMKRRVHRPGLLRMYLSDPSEAVDAGAIRGALSRLFEPVEVVEIGATLTQLVFSRISGNFDPEDPLANAYVELAAHIEETLIALGEIQSDQLTGVFRKASG
jgi:SAM-dependent methyltransferase